MTVRFSVSGAPVPQGSMRAYVSGGHANIVHSNARKLLEWREAVKIEGEKAAKGQGFVIGGAWSCTLEFGLPRPKSAKPGTLPTVQRNDLDKLVRSVLDALTGVLWEDDGQVCLIHAFKAYEDSPGLTVTAWQI